MPARLVRSRLLVPLVAAATVVAGCGGPGEQRRADPPSSSHPRADSERTVEASTGRVELLEAGAEPREPLRLDLRPGDTTSATLEFQIRQEQEVDGRPVPPEPNPALRADLAFSVEDAAGDTFVVRYGYDSFGVADPDDVPADVVEQVGAALEGFEQVTGTTELNERGQTIGGSVDLPDEVRPSFADQVEQISDGIEQLSAPFPEEPVGIGARWMTTEEITVDGLTTRQQSIYHLVSHQDDRYVLDVTTTQTAEDQALDLPGAPDVSAELTGFDVAGSGRIEGSTGRVVPRHSRAETEGTIRFSLSEPNAEGGRSDGSIVQRQMVTMSLTSGT